MTDSIGDLLPKTRFQEPPEVQIIKDYIMQKFEQPVTVTVQPKQILIHVKSAALAGALRMHLWEIGRLCQTEKRLVLRLTA